MPSRTEKRLDADETGLTIGIDAGSFSASISTNGTLSLGIGVAEVNLNLKNLNESEINYAFGLYSIEGEQDGCTVVLRYYIAGQLAQTEYRTIPECGDEEDEEEDDDSDDDDDDNDDDDDGNPNTPNPRRNTGWYGTAQAVFECNIISSYKMVLFGSQKGETICNIKHFQSRKWRATRQIFADGYRWTISGVTKNSYSKIFALSGLTQYNYSNDSTTTGSRYVYSDAAAYLADPDRPMYPEWAYWYNLQDLQDSLNKKSFKDKNQGDYENTYTSLTNDLVTSGNSKESFSITKEWVILNAAKPNIKSKIKLPPPIKKEKEVDENCCQMIEEIYEALAIAELSKKGFIIPNRMIVPNGKGNTKLDNYLQILEWQLRQADHLGIHPFKAIVQDMNAAQKGNQTLELQMVNATAAAKTITELLLENKGDAATRLNLAVRTAIAVGQILNVVSITAKRAREIMRFVGVPVKEKTFQVKMPFDFTFGQRRKKGKGFSGGVNQKGIDALDINTEKATEELLPEFMTDEEQPIVVEMYDDSQPNLVFLIQKLLGQK